MKCEFCGFEEKFEIDVFDYERYGGMKLCDRCVDKFDAINNGHDNNKIWTDRYSECCGLPPFPIKDVYPTSNTENQTYGCRKE